MSGGRTTTRGQRRRLGRLAVINLPGLGLPMALVPDDAQELLSAYMDKLGLNAGYPRRVLALTITWRVRVQGEHRGAAEHFAHCLFGDGRVEERQLPAEVGAMLHAFLWCKTPVKADVDRALLARLDAAEAARVAQRQRTDKMLEDAREELMRIGSLKAADDAALGRQREELDDLRASNFRLRNEITALQVRLQGVQRNADDEATRLRANCAALGDSNARLRAEITSLQAQLAQALGLRPAPAAAVARGSAPSLDLDRAANRLIEASTVVPTARPASARQAPAPTAAARPAPAPAPPPPAAPAHPPESTRFALLEID